MIEFTLTGRIPSKKNSKSMFLNRRTGKMFITASKDYKAWHEEQFYNIKSQANQRQIQEPISKPLTASYWFTVGDKRLFDLSNKIESINDILVDVGVLADDNYTIISSIKIFPVVYEKGVFKLIVKLDGN